MPGILKNPSERIANRWRRFWLKRSGPRGFGRFAARLASLNTHPYHQRAWFADLSPKGFVACSAVLTHPDVRLGVSVYIGDKVIISNSGNGGPIELGDRVHLYGDSFVDTGSGGSIQIGAGTHIQPGCHLHAHISEIRIGRQVEIAPCCAFYNYDHGMLPGVPIMEQPLKSKGGIFVGDGAWIGHGVTVLQGVRIGEGAVIAAGAVVVHDVPENAIAAGVPARVVGHRTAADESPSENKITPITTNSLAGSKELIRKI
jgi:acetyltransferase-like isoleucine patch superfamily enzyme